MTGCCTHSGPGGAAVREAEVAARARSGKDPAGEPVDPTHGLVGLAGGPVRVGSDDPDHPEEWPERDVRVAPYAIGRCAVTNADFDVFVRSTGHRTDAEAFVRERADRGLVFEITLGDDPLEVV